MGNVKNLDTLLMKLKKATTPTSKVSRKATMIFFFWDPKLNAGDLALLIGENPIKINCAFSCILGKWP